MNRKRTAAAIGIVIVGLILFFMARKDDLQTPRDGYIFDRNAGISIKEVADYRKNVVFEEGGKTTDAGGKKTDSSSPDNLVNVRELLSGDIPVSSLTLKYFKYIQSLFKEAGNMAEHLESVRAYLFEQLPAGEARELFEIYERYLRSEMKLTEKLKEWGTPGNTEEILAFLASVQAFRREELGAEIADAMFGAEVKAREYAVRRGAIITNKDMHGAEKEALIADLNQDMWGEEAERIEEYPEPYNRYREKISIYQKDLDELPSEEDRASMIRSFRETFFDPETIQRLDDLDVQLAREKQVEAAYFDREREIRDRTGLSGEEKEARIQALQEEMFGEDVEAFRRRQILRNEMETRKRKYDGE